MRIKDLEDKQEITKWLSAIFFPLVFLFVLFLIKIIENSLETSFYRLGVFPLTGYGLVGILSAPLVHKDWEHLINNAIPILILVSFLFYFHKSKAVELFLAMYFISGIWLWIIGRPVYHIGASGLVYALAAFHIAYGFVVRNPPMLAIGFLVILFYGSMIWFVLPLVEDMSWEAHLCGAVCGVLLAIYFGNEYKRKTVQVSGSMHFSHDKRYAESVEYVYWYKKKEL